MSAVRQPQAQLRWEGIGTFSDLVGAPGGVWEPLGGGALAPTTGGRKLLASPGEAPCTAWLRRRKVDRLSAERAEHSRPVAVRPGEREAAGTEGCHLPS